MADKVEDLKGFNPEVRNRDQWSIRTYPKYGNKQWPAHVATKVMDIPQDVLEELRTQAEQVEFKPYFAFNFGTVKHPWVDSIVEKYDEVQEAFFLKVDAKAMVLPHADPVRVSGLYAPLTPTHNYSPLEIYDDTIYTIGESEMGGLYAWDPKIIHAVFNQGPDRINLQFNVSISYGEFRQKYLSGV